MYFSEIKRELEEKGLTTSDEVLHKVLNYMLAIEGILIRDDNFNFEEKYMLLDRNYCQSSYSENYSSLEFNNQNQKILLISDTHIGNDSLASFDLINKAYEYGKLNNLDGVIHLGDLFEGEKYLNQESNNTQEFLRQLEMFIKNYPTYLRTYGIIGNHDALYHELFRRRMLKSFDLRALLMFNPNYIFIPKKEISFNIGNKLFHLAHRFYLNNFLKNEKVSNLDDLEYLKILGENFSNMDIHISGHLHESFVYSVNDDWLNKQNLYISVPSLSKFNIDSTCALRMDVNFKDGKLDEVIIIPLMYDENKIVEREPFVWNIQKENKLVRKML